MGTIEVFVPNHDDGREERLITLNLVILNHVQ
jgi:hypothetical protein